MVHTVDEPFYTNDELVLIKFWNGDAPDYETDSFVVRPYHDGSVIVYVKYWTDRNGPNKLRGYPIAWFDPEKERFVLGSFRETLELTTRLLNAQVQSKLPSYQNHVGVYDTVPEGEFEKVWAWVNNKEMTERFWKDATKKRHG